MNNPDPVKGAIDELDRALEKLPSKYAIEHIIAAKEYLKRADGLLPALHTLVAYDTADGWDNGKNALAKACGKSPDEYDLDAKP